MPKNIRMDSLHVFTDKLFTSLPLVMALKDERIGHTGTVRQNRRQGCPLTFVATMKKASGGDTSVALETNQGSTRCAKVEGVVRWKDTSVVTVASTIISSDH